MLVAQVKGPPASLPTPLSQIAFTLTVPALRASLALPAGEGRAGMAVDG